MEAVTEKAATYAGQVAEIARMFADEGITAAELRAYADAADRPFPAELAEVVDVLPHFRPGDPSPCCADERLFPAPWYPGYLICSECGHKYPACPAGLETFRHIRRPCRAVGRALRREPAEPEVRGGAGRLEAFTGPSRVGEAAPYPVNSLR